ncbi:MAG: type II secretion system protein [Patescibacteria group bacterium]
MKKKKAFSIIEVLIVIAIIGIMTAATIVSLQSGKTDKELETAAREVSAAIREAQNNALTGKNASSSCQYYDFTYTASSTNYSVGTVSGSGCPLASYTLKNGVTFVNGGSFNFSIPFGGVTGISGIKITKNNVCYCVSINSSGSVEERGKLSTCSASCS